MIGCVACEYVDTCPDAFADVAQYCGELLDQAQRQYEEALAKIDGIAHGIDDAEESHKNE